MNNLQRKKYGFTGARRGIRFVVIAAVMLLAGVCYCCSREPADLPIAEQENELLLSEVEETIAKAASQTDESVEVSDEEGREQEETPEMVVHEEASCFVHICGAVNVPGVYELPQGSRIYQAVDMAGGFLPEADQGFLNLAQPVSDGMKITVLTMQEAETAAEGQGIFLPGSKGSSPESGGALSEKKKVNINTAGKEELMSLRGIGESRAEDIIAYREKHGSFQKIEDIMKVSGIKDAAFEKIKDDITV